MTSPVERVERRSGGYADSVTLMQVSRTVAAVPGVLAAQVAMGTDLNLDVLRGMGFRLPDEVGPNDLLIALRAEDDAALDAADEAVTAALAPRRPGGTGGGGAHAEFDAPTIGSAAARGDATLALISLPGQHAFTEAMDALDAGLDVMLFSDNVPVEQEVLLKDVAAERGLLVMGPDCGTAVVGGVGLGFANVVAPGPVGVVAASGTGAQQVLCLLDGAGVGVRHCLGVGGRDLSSAVGGRSTRQALRLLDDDPEVRLIVLVSKPPAPDVADQIRGFVATLGTPVIFALLGAGQPDLTQAVERAVIALGGQGASRDGVGGQGASRDRVADVGAGEGATRPWTPPRTWGVTPSTPRGDQGIQPDQGIRHDRGIERSGGFVRGAFSGGTLCDEAMQIASAAVGPIASNIPLAGAPRVGPDLILETAPVVEDRAELLDHAEFLDHGGVGHAMIDFGDDELTRGRPHPMIDGTLRIDWILKQAADPATGTILLDVVLGHGSHPDPAADLAPALDRARALAAAQGRSLRVVVSLCGTASDPQGLDRQAEALVGAGAEVYASNAAAARAAFDIAPPNGVHA